MQRIGVRRESRAMAGLALFRLSISLSTIFTEFGAGRIVWQGFTARNHRTIQGEFAMKWTTSSLLVSAALVALLFSPSQASAQTTVDLGTAADFGVLGASAITNTGPTIVTGDLGISPNGASSVTGFTFSGPPGPGIVNGTTHFADAVALQAQNDVTTAYNDLAGRPCDVDLTGSDLGTVGTLTPGVYCFSTSAQLTGTLTLDAGGDPDAEFIFQIGSTLTTASNSVVDLIDGGSECNVWWQVGSSATLGTTTQFAGNILALTSITLNTGANGSGRLLARNGAVTLDTNGVAVCPACPVISLAPTTLPNGVNGSPYSETITASEEPDDLLASYTFTVSSGALPTGLGLSGATATTVDISGTPTVTGSFTFTITATDANGCLGSRVYTIVINAVAGCPDITLSPTTLPPAIAGIPYGPETITADESPDNLLASYLFTITSGALPDGLSLTNPTATTIDISGTPEESGSFTFTLTATDSITGCIGSQIYSFLGACPVITVEPDTLSDGQIRGVYGPVTFTASGGTEPYTFSVLPGTLPPGLTLTPEGVLSGTATTAGSYTFTITATDANGCEGGQTYDVVIAPTIPALDSLGLGLFILLLAAAGVFLVGRIRM